MSKTKTYLFHEVSSYLPLLEGEDFDALVEDIKQFGQIESAILYEGKILDGRNRYRACKQLDIALKTREWKPSEATGMTPLQFVISENIMRRHLNTAQRSEIGLLLLEEEEKLAEKRSKAGIKIEEQIQTGKLPVGSKVGESREIVGKKVRVSAKTISRAKKIKKIAEEDKEIAEDWEKAKKGEIGLTTIYKKVQEKEFVKSLEETEPEVKKAIEDKILTPKEAKEVITLPEELKKAVIKPKSKITIKDAKEVAKLPKDIITEVAKEGISVDDAKEIADIPKPEIRKEAIKHIKKEKELHKDTIKHITNIAKGVTPPPTKIIDIDQRVINQFITIKKQIIIKMSRKHIESYNDSTQNELIRIMKECLEYLQKELNIKGDIINV
jgi:hypothetical protein